jgi:hypothetical protein
MPDSLLATELARALDGEETRVAEAEQLAALLRSAADVARFEVDPGEAEHRLADVRRRVQAPTAAPARRRRIALTPRRALAGTLAAAAVAAAVLVALPEAHPPGPRRRQPAPAARSSAWSGSTRSRTVFAYG